MVAGQLGSEVKSLSAELDFFFKESLWIKNDGKSGAFEIVFR